MIEDPEFLTVDDVLELHRDQIERYGGDPGIRDRGLIEAAVAMSQQSFGGQFLHADLFEMAAAYAFHLAESQAVQLEKHVRGGESRSFVAVHERICLRPRR